MARRKPATLRLVGIDKNPAVLRRPRRLTERELNKARVTLVGRVVLRYCLRCGTSFTIPRCPHGCAGRPAIIDDHAVELQCQVCGNNWIHVRGQEGKLNHNYWRCSHGCNARALR